MTILIGTGIGALAGFLYWKFVGCATGTCAITNNKYTSSIYGALIGLMLATSGCTSAQNHDEQTSVNNAPGAETMQTSKINEDIDAASFAEKLANKDNVILDVRTPAEFGGGHIAGAININYNAPDFAAQVNKLDKNKTYLVYCQRGARSAGAAGIMSSNGFNTIFTLQGGLNNWHGELVK